MAREQERTQGGQGQVKSKDEGQPRLCRSQGLKEVEGIADGEEGQGLPLVGEGAPIAELAGAQAGEGEEAQREEVAAEVAEEEALAGQEPAGEGQERHEHHGGRGDRRCFVPGAPSLMGGGGSPARARLPREFAAARPP